tara:strand:+ start:103 stop:555 length:453 start_codon:yes stop_codon:yes gene_type:complete
VNKIKKISQIITFAIFILNFAFATIIYIPEDYSTIQAGLNVALEGDTVLVGEGTFAGVIQWPQVNGISLIGAGVNRSIIDGMNDDAVLLIRTDSQEPPILDSLTVVDGFTLTNGNGPYTGGGMLIVNASPTLRNLEIADNTAFWGGVVFP